MNSQYNYPSVKELRSDRSRLPSDFNLFITSLADQVTKATEHVQAKILQAASSKDDDRKTIESLQSIFRDTGKYIDATLSGNQPSIYPGIPPMHLHPEAQVIGGDDLERLADAATTSYESFRTSSILRKAFDSVMSVWLSVNSLRQLNRYLHKGQPSLRKRILPDGSNISDSDEALSFKHEWLLRRIWVRLLHLPGLIRIPNNPSSGDFAMLLPRLWQLGKLLLEVELDRTNTSRDINLPGYSWHHDDVFANPRSNIDYSWIGAHESTGVDLLNEMASLAYAEHQTTAGRFGLSSMRHRQAPLDKNQRFSHNLHPDRAGRTFRAMLETMNVFMRPYPFTRLLIDLMAKENEFEIKLAEEHAEDTLLSKRVVSLDERQIITTEGYGPSDILNSYSNDKTFEEREEVLYKTIQAIGHVNRQRYNFRLSRDWSDGRPWRKIYQLYDTDQPETAFLKEQIDRFTDEHFDFDAPQDNNPSNPFNILWHLFGVWPIDVGSHGFGGKPPTPRQSCSLPACGQMLAGGGVGEPGFQHTQMDLPCGCGQHFFHLLCIFNYWDEPGRYLHTCPNCGEDTGLAHEKVGIVHNNPDVNFSSSTSDFLFNVWGYEPLLHDGIDTSKPMSEEMYHSRMQISGITESLGRPYCQKVLRKVFYDMPIEGQDDPSKYWLYENLAVLCEREAASDPAHITWDRTEIYPNYLNDRGRVVNYLDMNDWQQYFYVLANVWVARNREAHAAQAFRAAEIPASRTGVISAELANLRNHRRQRDRRRRERVKAACKGLHYDG